MSDEPMSDRAKLDPPQTGPRARRHVGSARAPVSLRRKNRWRPDGDDIFKYLVAGLGVCILLVTLLAAWELLNGGRLAFSRYGFGFLVSSDWDPVHEAFGALPFIVGTLLTSFGALVLAVPLALASALFVSEYAPRWLAEPVSYLVELIAAIPSVVIGFWGIFVLVPLIRRLQIFLLTTPGLKNVPFFKSPPSGLGLFTAILILAVMVIPYTASVARDVLRLVPKDQREAAYALGATKWEVMRYAVLPYARAGIFGGIILSLGRALGETMAVTMVIGNRTDFPQGLFGQTATMSSIIANEFTEAVSDIHLSSLIAIGFILFIITIVMNYLARLLIARLTPEGISS